MKKGLLVLYLVLQIPLFLTTTEATAQRNRSPYTGSNRVLLTLDGLTGRYEFMTTQALVRYNKDTQQLECILPVETFLPLQDTIPADMAYEVLFGAKYPQVFISLAAPVQKINAANLGTETIRRKTAIRLQNVTQSIELPVSFSSESTSVYFTTTLDLRLEDFETSLPIKYLPLLTGRMLITIDRARWVDLTSR